MDVNAFAVDLVKTWRERDCMDIDGADFQDMLIKHGLALERPATEDDCKEEWTREWGIEPGDSILVNAPEFSALYHPTQED